jgi:hypothetical protein
MKNFICVLLFIYYVRLFNFDEKFLLPCSFLFEKVEFHQLGITMHIFVVNDIDTVPDFSIC